MVVFTNWFVWVFVCWLDSWESEAIVAAVSARMAYRKMAGCEYISPSVPLSYAAHLGSLRCTSSTDELTFIRFSRYSRSVYEYVSDDVGVGYEAST